MNALLPLVIATADRDLLAALAFVDAPVIRTGDAMTAALKVDSLGGQAVLAYGPDIAVAYRDHNPPGEQWSVLLHTDPERVNYAGAALLKVHAIWRLPTAIPRLHRRLGHRQPSAPT